MGLDSLLMSLKSGVTKVTQVQTSLHNAITRNPEKLAGVAEVADTSSASLGVTFATLPRLIEVTEKAAQPLVCTPVPAVTPDLNKYGTDLQEAQSVSRWWKIHYSNRDPLTLACFPMSARAEVLRRFSDAVGAESFTPSRRPPTTLMTADEETAIRSWLALIEETDPATIAEVIGQCQRDADARDYFTRRAAAELPKPDPFPDDRRTCDQCANLIARRCQAAKRGEIVASRNYEPIRDLPRRCEGYAPGAADADRRPGRERWPGLTDTKGTK